MQPVHVWIRSESRSTERRTPLAPADVLHRAGLTRLSNLQAERTTASQLGSELESEIDDQEATVGFRDIDKNDDGLIDFEEFVAWWTED